MIIYGLFQWLHLVSHYLSLLSLLSLRRGDAVMCQHPNSKFQMYIANLLKQTLNNTNNNPTFVTSLNFFALSVSIDSFVLSIIPVLAGSTVVVVSSEPLYNMYFHIVILMIFHPIHLH